MVDFNTNLNALRNIGTSQRVTAYNVKVIAIQSEMDRALLSIKG